MSMNHLCWRGANIAIKSKIIPDGTRFYLSFYDENLLADPAKSGLVSGVARRRRQMLEQTG